MRPIFVGPGRALVRLDGGEYLVVDTNSIDAIPYLLGRPIEPDALFVFRCFLRPDSVVLDIGANFGLYTAVAGKVVARNGELYAFEGNPLTFECLLRTYYANHLHLHPRIKPINMLVSDRCGEGKIYYTENVLGGATMTDIGEDAAKHLAAAGLPLRAAENRMTTIDAFLPPDCAVDLVKIDAEGHEPLIMRGMARTIAQSPHIRFIIEFNEAFLSYTVAAAEFLNAIHGLGFRICRIRRRAPLELIAPGEPVHEPGELLLTRTPEADMQKVAAAARRLRVRLKRAVQRAGHDLLELWYRL
jgi:FkbM family methyltransferase